MKKENNDGYTYVFEELVKDVSGENSTEIEIGTTSWYTKTCYLRFDDRQMLIDNETLKRMARTINDCVSRLGLDYLAR